jgi:hypothetical protein
MGIIQSLRRCQIRRTGSKCPYPSTLGETPQDSLDYMVKVFTRIRRRSKGSGFRVQGSGFRVQGSGFRV